MTFLLLIRRYREHAPQKREIDLIKQRLKMAQWIEANNE